MPLTAAKSTIGIKIKLQELKPSWRSLPGDMEKGQEAIANIEIHENNSASAENAGRKAAMKKEICAFLSFVLLFVMTGCGNQAAQGDQENVPLEPEVQTEQTINSNEASSETESRESSGPVSKAEQEPDMEQETLVVYFSATGTTKLLAEYAAEVLNADLYEIVPEEPYTDVDLAYYTNGRADREQNDPDARPAISGSVENMEDYDTIILGYPIWHGQAPRIINTFLESYDFSGKSIIPFCTSHSSGIGSSADHLHASCSEQTNWKPGKRFEAGGASMEIMQEWLKGI